MAEALTYNSLVSDTQSYLERGGISDPDVHAQIPRFIMYAERRIELELKGLAGLRVVSANFVAGEWTVVKPDNWRETSFLMYITAAGERKSIYPRSYTYCRRFWPTETQQEAPRYYSDYNPDYWLIVPTPDSGYQFELGYFEEVQQLDGSNQTNWYTDKCPQLLLQAVMLEAMIYLKNDDRVQLWQGLYDRSFQALMGEFKQLEIDQSQERAPK